MFKSLIASLGQIVAKPQVLLAGIIATIFQTIILYFSLEPLGSVFEKAILLGELPNVGLMELPFQFYKMYFAELNVILLAFLASMVLQLWLGVVIARFASNLHSKKAGIMEAVGFGIKSLGKIIGAIIFLLAIAGIFFALFQIIAWLSEFSNEASLILLFLLGLLIAYLYVKLVFFIPLMGCKEANVRDALAEAWEFSKKKFWRILILLVIVSIIAAVIDFIGSSIAGFTIEDIIASIIISLFAVIGSTYSALVLANYYLNHEHEHPKMFYEGRHRRRK